MIFEGPDRNIESFINRTRFDESVVLEKEKIERKGDRKSQGLVLEEGKRVDEVKGHFKRFKFLNFRTKFKFFLSFMKV